MSPLGLTTSPIAVPAPNHSSFFLGVHPTQIRKLGPWRICLAIHGFGTAAHAHGSHSYFITHLDSGCAFSQVSGVPFRFLGVPAAAPG